LGRREKAENGGFGWALESFWEFWNFGGISEKGSRRECTEKWVTRWNKMFLGEYWVFTLIYEENWNGGILNWAFLGFYSGFYVGLLRRGDKQCAFWGFNVCQAACKWVDLRGVRGKLVG
jgi:hypothetical protein